MSDVERERLVYDCNVYLQAMINPNGPGGRCVELALSDQVKLFVSAAVLDEIRTLPKHPVCVERDITQPVVDGFIKALLQHAERVDDVPELFRHPIDKKDSCYVNLAIAADAKLIVSRDNHLLNLTNPAKPWSREFRERFPDIHVLRPDEYLAERERRLEPQREPEPERTPEVEPEREAEDDFER